MSPSGVDPSARRDRLRRMLSGGDRRSLAQANDVLELVLARAARVGDLARLTADADWLVTLRALDVLEKVAHVHPEWLQRHRQLFLGPLSTSDQWEVRLQIVRALPLLRWTPRERARATRILLDNVRHSQPFVRAWALDGLVTLGAGNAALANAVERELRRFERSSSHALNARARKIRSRLRAGAQRPAVRNFAAAAGNSPGARSHRSKSA